MKNHYIEDAFLVSFPKAGRTWIRVMLAKLLQMNGGNPKKLELIRFRHDGAGALIHHASKESWKDDRVILLVRSPKDIIVSFYFQVTLREKKIWGYEGTLSDFIRSEKYGINTVIKFYNCWAENLSVPKNLMLLRYEYMHENPLRELTRICNFLDLPINVDLKEVIEYSSFDNMKEMDRGKKDHLLSNRGGFMSPGDNPERFKVRKGKISGYLYYLNKEDIAYVDEQTKFLNSYYGYS